MHMGCVVSASSPPTANTSTKLTPSSSLLTSKASSIDALKASTHKPVTDENRSASELNHQVAAAPQQTVIAAPLSSQEEKRQSAVRVRARCRNRLSVTYNDIQGFNNDNEDARGLIYALEAKTLLEFLPLANAAIVPAAPVTRNRRWSVGSMTDADMHRRESYADKSTETHGFQKGSFSPEEHGVGFACKKGLKPVSPNQDSFLILHVEGVGSIYGVFDGHGKRGHDVSNFVKSHLPKILVAHPKFNSDPLEALREAYEKTQKLIEHVTHTGEIDGSASGTTTTVVIRRPEGIYVSHVGDSRAVLARPGRSAIDLTIDHKPDLPEERARVESRGGIVIKQPYDVNHRVYVKGERYPGLAMSRALGDLIGNYDAGVSAEPTLSFVPASEYENGPAHLLVCSDGVWEFISSQEAADMTEEGVKHSPMRTAEELARRSWDLWIAEEGGQVVDDITALVVKL